MSDHLSPPMPHLGIPSLDLDHAFEGDLLRTLQALAHSDDETDEALRDVIQQFIDHILVHCESEELLMKLYGYPGVDAHRRVHATMVGKARALADALEHGGRHSLPQAIETLLTWLTNHVKVEDTRLSNYLSRLGASHASPVKPDMSG